MRKQNSDFRTGFVSEAGNKLKNNDYFGFVELDEYACYVIADGITDLPGADSARLAIETVILKFQENPSMSKRAVKRWIREANRVLLERESYKKRKASLTVVVTNYQSMRYGYLGNTRLRMYRNGHIFLRTEDMSLSQELVEEEQIPKDALREHEERNNLYSYLGHPKATPFVSKKIKLSETDIITMYTRGIWENIDETELDEVFAEADNEVQNSLDNVEDMLLSRQPENLENYTFAAIFVNKVYSDPGRAKKRKKIILIVVIVIVVVAVIVGVCYFLYQRRQRQIADMNYYYTNAIEYINTDNFVRAKEDCEKAEELAEKLKDDTMRSKLQEYLFVIETVMMADESYSNGKYEDAHDSYLKAMDRARYADQIGTEYMERRLDKIADYISVTDYIALGDSWLEKADYERAEEKYLLAKNIATDCYYTEGADAAMTALENLYAEWTKAQEEEKKAADEQAGKEVSAAQLVASGDKACVDKDFVGANVYYTMALAKYRELEDTVNEQYTQSKIDSVDTKIKELEEKRRTAQSFEQQGIQLQGAGDYWGAKAQYLQAKNLYLELESETDVERLSNTIAQIDTMIEE